MSMMQSLRQIGLSLRRPIAAIQWIPPSRGYPAREGRIARIGRGLDGRHGKLIAQSHGEANCAKSGRTRTVKSYSRALEHPAPRIGGKHVEEVTGKLIEEIVTARRHEGVTDATIKAQAGRAFIGNRLRDR